MKLFASIYVGSYEVTLKILQINRRKEITEIDCLRSRTGLVYDVSSQGRVLTETIDRVCDILVDMKRTMDTYQVDDYRAYAAPAVYLADNKLFLLEQIRLRCGISVTALSNSEHRFLGYKAVSSMAGFEEMIEESAAIVDVGGSSLQITLFKQGKVLTTQNLMLGTVTMGEDMKQLDHATNHREQISEVMYKELETFCTMYLQDIKLKYVILSGEHLPNIIELLGKDKETSSVKSGDYLDILEKLFRGRMKEYADSYDFFMGKEVYLQAFYLLHRAIAQKIPAKYIHVSGVSVVEGIAYDYFYEHKLLKAPHDFDADILSAAWAISKRYASYQPHLKTLQKLSLQIFDVMKKYHGMGNRERLLMSVVDILHDCGKYISISEASDCSYTIVMSSEILGLTNKEREMVAMVVAMNRKPLMLYDELKDKFSEEEYLTIVKLLAILKVANALDRSHKQKLKKVSMAVKKGELHITMESKDSIALERGLFQEKGSFFEEVFSIRPMLKENRII